MKPFTKAKFKQVMAMRLYWPKAETLTGKGSSPPLVKVK